MKITQDEEVPTLSAPVISARYLHELVRPPFRSPHGYYISKALFNECPLNESEAQSPLSDESGSRPIYTLKFRDYDLRSTSKYFRPTGLNRLRSFPQLYLEYNDPGEYQFAVGVFGTDGGWDHWVKIRDSQWFAKTYAGMREMLSAKIESEAIQAARKVASTTLGPQALQAAKWLHALAKGPSKGRGRPSKDEIAQELKQEVEAQRDLDEDLTRLGL